MKFDPGFMNKVNLILANTAEILSNQQEILSKMATLSADVQAALTAISTEVTDVATLIQNVANSGVTPQQQADLETAITSLQQSDASIQAIINPPAPTPGPTPTPTPQQQARR
jgi:hypothetical protein